jgi:uncharacterized protein
MAQRGIAFAYAPAPAAADDLRLDAALIVGLAVPHAGPLSETQRARLRALGHDAITDSSQLIGLPLTVTSMPDFFSWFATDRATRGSAMRASTVLAATARAFFQHGGRDLTVVALGAPPAAGADEPTRIRALARLVGAGDRWDAATQRSELLATWLPSPGEPSEPTTWHGVGQLAGLAHPALVLVPDLCELTAVQPAALPPQPVPLDPAFALCCDSPQLDQPTPPIAAPHHDEDGCALWRRLVNHWGTWIARHARTAQLVVAAPVPEPTMPAADYPQRLIERCGVDRDLDAGGIASAFIVAAWPQVSGPLAAGLPGARLGADGVVAGLIAANSRGRGYWRSALGLRADVIGATPLWPLVRRDVLAERLCMIEPMPGGWRLGSDVSTSGDPTWRPGAVCRIMAGVIRAARRIGEDFTFAPSGPATWRALAGQLAAMLDALTARGGLAAGVDEPPYRIACDRSTMTQADLDAGRLVVRVELRPAHPIGAITVVLAGSGGRLVPVTGGAP